MLTEIAKQQLRKAGWYEGRKIDLTKYEEEYAKLGLKLFPAARKFLEEFGDLDIQDKYLSTSTDKNGNRILIINRSVTGIPYCCFKPSQEIIDKVGKNILPVGLIDHGNIYIYIYRQMVKSIPIGIISDFGQRTLISFGMNTMVKMRAGQHGTI